jgi:hypothetical protein
VSFLCSGDERLIGARSGEKNDFIGAQFRGFFQTPLEAVEFHERDQQVDLKWCLAGGHRLDQREVDAVIAALGERDIFDSREPNSLAVAQLIQLAGLGAQNSAEMFGSVAAQGGGIRFKSLDKETAAHQGSLPHRGSGAEVYSTYPSASTEPLDI